MVDIDELQPHMPPTSVPQQKQKMVVPSNISMDVMRISDVGRVLKFGIRACDEKIEKLQNYEKVIKRNIHKNRKQQDAYFKVQRKFKDMDERYRINGELKPEDLEFWQQQRDDLGL